MIELLFNVGDRVVIDHVVGEDCPDCNCVGQRGRINSVIDLNDYEDSYESLEDLEEDDIMPYTVIFENFIKNLGGGSVCDFRQDELCKCVERELL
jgi:hypothetical protein